jgi:anti-sigma factor RsiW
MKDLTCRDFVTFLDAYLAGELGPEERARFDYHLAACPSCVAYMNTYSRSVELVRGLREAEGPVPAEMPEELVPAILEARREG